MKVVLDSNVFVSSLNSFSPFHLIFESLVRGDFEMIISTDIALNMRKYFRGNSINQKQTYFSILLKHQKM